MEITDIEYSNDEGSCGIYTFDNSDKVQFIGDGMSYCEYRLLRTGEMWSAYDLVETLPKHLQPYAKAIEEDDDANIN